MYIPLLDTLQSQLNNSTIIDEVSIMEVCETCTILVIVLFVMCNVLLQVNHSHENVSLGLLCDYCDSQHFRKHPLFSSDNSSLQLIFYYDELEICNPFRSRRTKHKIGKYIHFRSGFF